MDVAIQVDSQSYVLHPACFLATDIDSHLDVLSVVSSDDLVETASPSPSCIVTPASSTKGSSMQARSVDADDNGRSHSCVSEPAESEPRPIAPASNACTLGQTTYPPSPESSFASSASSGGLPGTPPPLHLREMPERRSDVREWASRLANPTSTTIPPPAERPAPPSWHCRSCGKDPCDDPTATVCGHIFCHRYVCLCCLLEIPKRSDARVP